MAGVQIINNNPTVHTVEGKPVKVQATGRLPAGQEVIVIDNDRNTLKGCLWGVGTFYTGSATISLIATTAALAVTVPPLALVTLPPTIICYWVTKKCLKNTFHHFSQPPVVIVNPTR